MIVNNDPVLLIKWSRVTSCQDTNTLITEPRCSLLPVSANVRARYGALSTSGRPAAAA